jgi:drug/metabolite transporter (DMT)-like permease
LTESILVALAVLLRIFSNPLGNVYQKQLSNGGIHPLWVNFLTYLLLSLVCLGFVARIDWSELSQQFWIYSVLGGMVGTLGNGFLVKALEKGDLSILGPINSYKAVIGIIVGIFLLGEYPNLWGIVGISLIIFGSYFVLDTTPERFTTALFKKSEIQYRLWAMILTAVEAVFVKKVILASTTGIAFISWCCFGAIFSFLLLFLYRVNRGNTSLQLNFMEYKKFLLLILCMGTMQLTTNYTFQHMDVGYALSLFQLSTIVSVWLGYGFFREQHIGKKLLGAAIMVLGSIVIVLLQNR